MQKAYIPEIDVLRAVAVLSVMVCHLNAVWLPGGFAGVDVFFVISGYVVTTSLLGRTEVPFGTFMLGFYARRCLRILPALFLVIALTAIATVLFVPEAWLSEAGERTGLYALFGFSNHALYLFDDGYFAPRSDYNPFTHTWSLGVEEQFYLLVPLVLFVALAARRQGLRRAAVAGIAGLALASLGCAGWLSLTDPKAAYYLLPARFWELAAGVLLALAHRRKVRGGGPNGQGRGALLLGTLCLTIGFAFTDPALFPIPWALAPVLGTVLLIHGVFTADMRTMPAVVTGLLGNGVLRYIGRISYGLYLFHWPIFVLMRWTSGLESAGLYLIAVAATFLCATASYHLVEMPMRRAGRGGIRRGPVVAAGLGAILASVVAFSGLFGIRDRLALTVTADKSLWQARYTPRPSDYAGEVFPGRTLFAVGDSHLGAYEPMIRWTAADLQMQLRLFPTQGCQFGSLYFRLSQTPECTALADRIMAEITAAAKPGDIVFFAALRNHRLVDQWVVFDADRIDRFNASDRYRTRLRDAAAQNTPYFKALADLGLHIVIDLPKPNMPAVPYRCADWFNRMNPICQNGLTIPRARLEALNAPMVDTLTRLQETLPGVHLWNPFPPLCPDETCAAFMDGKPLFYDGDHISQYGNAVLHPYFRAEIAGVLAGAL